MLAAPGYAALFACVEPPGALIGHPQAAAFGGLLAHPLGGASPLPACPRRLRVAAHSGLRAAALRFGSRRPSAPCAAPAAPTPCAKSRPACGLGGCAGVRVGPSVPALRLAAARLGFPRSFPAGAAAPAAPLACGLARRRVPPPPFWRRCRGIGELKTREGSNTTPLTCQGRVNGLKGRP